jgi:hypothetical protein
MFDLQLSVLFKNIFEVCDAICSTYRYVASVKCADKLAKRETLDLCNLWTKIFMFIHEYITMYFALFFSLIKFDLKTGWVPSLCLSICL